MKVRILQGFASYTPGQVFDDWPDGMSEIFIAKGLIERMQDEVEVEVAEQPAAVERAEVPHKRKRK
jgi:hypothetical protein